MAHDDITRILEKLNRIESKFDGRLDQLENGFLQHRTAAIEKWEKDTVFLEEVATFMKATKDTLECVRTKLNQMKPWMSAEETLGSLRSFAVFIAPLAMFGVFFGGLWIALKRFFI